MDYQHLVMHPRSRPILIAAGALGQGVPATPLVVSPQHRVLVSSPLVERMTGQAEIMVPAKKLLGMAGVEQYLPDFGVTYVHILCETHELVNANGTFVETMYLGEQSKNLLGREDFEDIAECRPGLADQMVLHPAAQSGEAFRGKISNLVRRHTSNHREIVQRGAPRGPSAQP